MENETKKSSLLSKWKNREKKEVTRTRIPKAPDGAAIPLSSAQQRLWFLQRLLPENPVYNYAESFVLKGKLNEAALEHSLRRVFEENRILRAFYPYENGSPVQVINEESEIELKRFDLSALPKVHQEKQKLDILLADAKRHFNLDEYPLVRTTLIKLNSDEHVFLLTMHHIIFDKWSMNLFLEELAAYYVAFSTDGEVERKDENSLQFTDYVFWLKNRELDASQMAYWKTKLGGEIPLLALPTDFPLPANPSYQGTSFRTKFSSELSKQVLDLSKKLETTPYVLLLSVYYVLLHKYSGQKDIVVGSPISLRNDTALENVIGFFDETLVLRTGLASQMTFPELVKQVRKTVLEAFSNKDIPFEALVKALSPKRSLSVNPFFRVMFIYHSVTEVPSFGPELELSHSFFNPGVSKFDLTLYVANENGLLSTGFEYATDIFEESTIIQFQEHLRLVLEAITAEPLQKIADIAMLTEGEKSIFLEKPNAVESNISSYTGIHHVIEHVAKTRPDKTALTFDGVSISYETLNRKAGIVATALLEKTNKSNETIVLCAERSIDMIVGMIGILKAGCAYLPIDPNYPSERLDFILEDAKADIILTQSSLTAIFDGLDKELLTLDTIQKMDNTNAVLPKVKSDDNAYIIYTSGSSGQPKGVPVTHSNIINSTAGRLDFYPKNPDAFLLLSSISFDSSKAGIFWTLCTGGNLVITENRIEQDISKIENLVQEHSVTHTLMLPSLYKLILEHGVVSKLDGLNTVIVAGEACAPAIADLHYKTLPDVGLYNEYGPTEATVWCLAHRIGKEDGSKGVPIGKPVAGAKIYLLNENMNLVPYGAVGDIFIGGPGVSSGYINKPELKETSFVPNPFSENAPDRLYRTGDLGRYRKDGNIEFLGRADQQVKIRGYRIELEELEKVMLNDRSVKDAVAMVHESDSESSRRLVAYIVANENFDADTLIRGLKSKVPDYMVPSQLIVVDTLPVLPNGKVDTKILRDMGGSRIGKEPVKDAFPTNAIEKKLVGIWEDVLNFKPVGIHDNFFEIGGDSILSIQVIAKARASGMELSPNRFFEYQTIAELADFEMSKGEGIKNVENSDEAMKHVVPIRATGSKPPLFCLHSGGSHFFFYNLFAEYLPSNRPVYAVQASGHEGEPTLHKSVAEMAVDFIAEIKKVQPQGPYHFLSYCFNTAIGVEIVRILEQEPEAADLIIADTMADYLSMFAPTRTKVRAMAFLERFKANPLQTFGNVLRSKIIRPLKNKVEYMTSSGSQKTIQRLHDNHINIYADYDWRPVESRIQLLLTEKPDIEFNAKLVASWERLAKKGLHVVRVNGQHNRLFLAPTVEKTAQSMESCMLKFENEYYGSSKNVF